ncbi:hypothetical protein WJX82_001610 [Trebouxia sp. C0006]
MGNQASRGRNRPQQEQPPQTFAYPPPQQVQGPPQHERGDAAKLTDEFQKLQVQQEKAVGGTSGANNV